MAVAVSSSLETVRSQRQHLRERLAESEAALIAYQEELNYLDTKEQKLLARQFTQHFIDDPVKAAAIGRQVLMAMVEDVDTLCVEDIAGKIDALVSDDRCRSDCGFPIEFDERERRVIARLASLDRDKLSIVVLLHQANPHSLSIAQIQSKTDLTYTNIYNLLKKTIDMGLVDPFERFDESIGRYRNYYRLSPKVTERIMRWGLQSTQATPNRALLAQAAPAQLCSSVELN
jgi:DNA-binding transcriptional ArsR family regulator